MDIYNHKAIEILSCFTGNEIIRFRKFIKSPYFNKHKIVIVLFNELKKYYPSFNSKKLTKEKLKLLISPTGNESTLRDAMSVLLKTLIEFIGIENYYKRGFSFKHITLLGLSEKQLFNVYDKLYKKYTDELEELRNSSLIEYFLYSYYINQTRFDELLQIRGKKKTLSEEVKVQNNVFLNLANHFVLQCFRIYYDLSTYKNIIDFDVNEFPVGKIVSGNALMDIMKCIKTSGKQQYIFNIYNLLFELKINNNDRVFIKYKKSIEKFKEKIGRDEFLFHNLELMDYCIKKDTFAFDNLFFAKQLFEIYTVILREKLYRNLSNDNSLIPELYMNILINAVKLRKFKWLESFISSYLKEVRASEKDNLGYISYSILYNSTGDNNLSQSFALKIKEKNKLALKIRRVIIIRNYTEMEMFEEALTEIESFKALIKRTSLLSGLEKQKLNTFLKLAKKVVLIENDASNVNREQFLNEIKQFTHSWFYKSWLLKKAEEIL